MNQTQRQTLIRALWLHLHHKHNGNRDNMTEDALTQLIDLGIRPPDRFLHEAREEQPPNIRTNPEQP